MYRGKKIVAVTPAGRRRYMDILKNYILSNPMIDEWKIWQNTTNPDDVSCISQLSIQSKKINIERRSAPIGHSTNIYKFFDNCIEPNTVYVRLDDDIVWMDHRSIQNLVDYRIDNPEFFLVYGNIINNAICDHIHQRMGVYPLNPIMGYNTFDQFGWRNPQTAENKHNNLLEKIEAQELQDYIFSQWILNTHERVSINVISWLGEEFAKFNAVVGHDEEEWLAVVKPKQLHMFNSICGTALFSHFAFYTQRDHMDKTNVLQRYKKISEDIWKICELVNKKTNNIFL